MSSEDVLWTTEATDPVLGARVGQVQVLTHPSYKCAGRACVVHNPSNHHMRDWPTVYRSDKGTTERQCPHGVGHPDPDDLAWHESQGRDWVGVHGCDGCCSPWSTRHIPIPVYDADTYTDDELPGMWERADMIGGSGW